MLDGEGSEKNHARTIGPNVIYVFCEVYQSSSVNEAFKKVNSRRGNCGILSNNFVILIYASATDTTKDDWDRVMVVNLKCPLREGGDPEYARGCTGRGGQSEKRAGVRLAKRRSRPCDEQDGAARPDAIYRGRLRAEGLQCPVAR